MKKYRIALNLFLSMAFALPSLAQVSIAPTSVFMDANGIASLYITNPSETAQEISVSFVFGYPGNDENGSLIMVYGDSVRAGQVGMGDRLRSFPRTFILAPFQQQTVRLQVRPDRSLPPGMQFTRIKVTSSAQTPDIEESATEGVSTQVNFRFDQVIAAFYKNGQTTTGLEIGNVETIQSEGKLNVIPEFTTTGNSPFLGSVSASLKNAAQQTVAQQQQTVALYFSGKRKVEIALPENLPAGDYTVELQYETKRADIPSSDLVQATPITKTVAVRIQ
ncbi:hypothetical protein P872_18540 [Rhodonellum psychrophilum GCM71 = DSM 17998]|uniref:P pilus assembly protein, chaperone PapD n=2 Tax=Rhodonellum TaxID=336827 RepID=U5BXI8_9BACT|nr:MULTISPECIES: hypothetical protein [Rhodonellum]ERM82289.1 hypothetical protein P872_18540 [Rhodonellum psychrophilum GCM71 = DSM 17998]